MSLADGLGDCFLHCWNCNRHLSRIDKTSWATVTASLLNGEKRSVSTVPPSAERKRLDSHWEQSEKEK